MSHIRRSHVSMLARFFDNYSFDSGIHTNERVLSCLWMSEVNVWRSHVAYVKEACHTCVKAYYTCVRSYVWHTSHMCDIPWLRHICDVTCVKKHVTHMTPSHMWRRHWHVTHVTESFHAWRIHICIARKGAHVTMWRSHVTYLKKACMSHMWRSHSTHDAYIFWSQEREHMSHMWRSHVTHVKRSYHTCESLLSVCGWWGWILKNLS